MNIAHAHNMTTSEFLSQYEFQAATPLEVELMRRLIQADDNLADSEDLQAIADLVTDYDRALGNVVDEIDSITQQLEDNEEWDANGPVYQAMIDLQSNVEGRRDKCTSQDNAIDWDNIIN